VTPAPETFATARLDAHRTGPQDAPFLRSMWSDPRVVATLGGPRDREQVDDMVEAIAGHWQDHGFGFWTLQARDPARPVGWVLLSTTDLGGPGVEVGWTIAADDRGQGLATEAADEAVRIGFTDLDLGTLVAFTLPDNVASRRVMEKLGFRHEGTVEHTGRPHVLYRLDRTTWKMRHG